MRKPFRSEVERHVRWAESNLPVLRMYGSAQVRRIVRQALDEVGETRKLITYLGGLAGSIAGFAISLLLIDSATSGTYAIVLAAVVAGLLAYLPSRWADHLLHRRIALIATGH